MLVHDGLLQGTEWSDTPDGRPGWAQRLVEAGCPASPAGLALPAPDVDGGPPGRVGDGARDGLILPAEARRDKDRPRV
ncbi:hypothetical protein [Pseudonocardia spinosispora]|uniref:hypothetical protein n=1 Tax=Pseudonocardia spinosispora TaxID=103441 RepID=UPI000422F2F7|nr:hypothetical protein [Pseudonocardia spinosispora]